MAVARPAGLITLHEITEYATHHFPNEFRKLPDFRSVSILELGVCLPNLREYHQHQLPLGDIAANDPTSDHNRVQLSMDFVYTAKAGFKVDVRKRAIARKSTSDNPHLSTPFDRLYKDDQDLSTYLAHVEALAIYYIILKKSRGSPTKEYIYTTDFWGHFQAACTSMHQAAVRSNAGMALSILEKLPVESTMEGGSAYPTSNPGASYSVQQNASNIVPMKRRQPDSISTQSDADQVAPSAKKTKTQADPTAPSPHIDDIRVRTCMEGTLQRHQNRRTAFEEVTQTVATLQLELNATKGRNEKLMDQLNKRSDELCCVREENTTMTRKVERQEHAFQTKLQKANDVGKEFSDQVSTAMIKMKGLEGQVDELAAENASLKGKFSAMAAEKDEKTIENFSLRQKIITITVEKNSDFVSFRKQINILRREKDSQSINFHKQITEISTLQSEVTAITAERDNQSAKFQEQIGNLKKDITTITANRDIEYVGLKKQINTLRSEKSTHFENFKKQIGTLKTDKERQSVEFKAQISTLRREQKIQSVESKKHISTLQGENHTQSIDFGKQIVILKSVNKDLATDKERLVLENASMTDDKIILAAENNSLSTEKAKLEEQVENLETEGKKVLHKFEELKTKLRDLENEF